MVQPKEPNANDRQLVALGRTLQILREEDDADLLVNTVLNYLTTEFEYSLIWIAFYDPIEHRLLGKGGVAPTSDGALLKQRMMLTPGDVLEQVVIQQRPIALPDLREESRAGEWRKIAQNLDIQGTVIFPIRHRDRCYGVALLGSSYWGVSPQVDEKARLSMVLGSLGAALSQIETEWRRQQVKRLDQPILTLLTRLRSISGLGARLEAIVEQTHEFIAPSRTNIYWFERERRYFWRRISNQQRTMGFNDTPQPASGITAQEVSGFYQFLLSDQVVSIGEAQSSLKADTTSRLMQQIRARSLLAAPILFQGELLGFLAVEGIEARIWAEEEKTFIRTAAQMIGLTAPLCEMEDTIEQIKRDRILTAEIARSIYSEDDWKATLKMAAEQVCKRLRVERFLVLLYSEEQEKFEICYQSQPTNRRPLAPALAALNATDWTLIEKSAEAVSIENLDGDLRFLAWRDRLLEFGLRSLVVCNTSIGNSLQGLVLIGHETPRTWNRIERELVQVVSQQIGLMLQQWQLQRQNEQQKKLNQTIQWGLNAMQQTQQLEGLQQSALQHIAQSLQVPVAAMVTWLPGQERGQLLTSMTANDRFALTAQEPIAIQTDSLVQWALQTHELLCVAVQDIPAETRHWLSGSGIGQVLIAALRTAPEHQPTGVLLVVDGTERRWSDYYFNLLKTLSIQVAWTRRHLVLMDAVASQRTELERLNWYKHRSIEEVHRSIAVYLRRLGELGNPKDPLVNTRQQQILRKINDELLPIVQLIREEAWQLQIHSDTISLISLLKRALARVEERIKQRQLWSQVHDETNLTVGSDVAKIELVLYELLLCACERSEVGGRIDLWCRQIDNRWLELSITDHGFVDPRLFQELEAGRIVDWLAPSLLKHPPGLHLIICQLVMQQVGGEFNLYQLEDGRVLSRLVLPLSTTSSITQTTS